MRGPRVRPSVAYVVEKGPYCSRGKNPPSDENRTQRKSASHLPPIILLPFPFSSRGRDAATFLRHRLSLPTKCPHSARRRRRRSGPLGCLFPYPSFPFFVECLYKDWDAKKTGIRCCMDGEKREYPKVTSKKGSSSSGNSRSSSSAESGVFFVLLPWTSAAIRRHHLEGGGERKGGRRRDAT